MATNRLYRDTENAMLGGVCAGFAKRFDLDPTIVRVAVIGLAVLTVGTTVLLYLALWIIMPAGAEADTRRPSRDQLSEEFRGAGERVAEAGRIVSRAAKQAAGEISALQNRPAAGESAAAEPTSDAASSAEAPSTESSAPEADATEPGSAESGSAESGSTESGNAEADESRTPDAPSSGTPGAPFTTPPAPPAGLQAPPPPPPPPPGPPDGPIPGPWGNDRPQQS